MNVRLFAAVTAFSALIALPAVAQDDDLLAPLTPTKKAPAKKAPAKKAPAKKEKTPISKKTPPPEKQPEEDLLAPLPAAAKTQLVVKLGGGVRPGAKLYVDGTEIQSGEPHEVAPGEHTVLVRRAGYSEFTKKLSVDKGKTAEVSAAIEPIASFASVTANVGGASVFLDGALIGSAPQNELVLPPGSHELVVKKDGFNPDKDEIAAKPGKDYVFNAQLAPVTVTSTVVASSGASNADRPTNSTLTPNETNTSASAITSEGTEGSVESGTESPLYKKWYLWVGVAAVAGAGAITAVSLSSRGQLTEKNICGEGGCTGGCLPAGACGSGKGQIPKGFQF